MPKQKVRIILASESETRALLLKNVGFDFEVISFDCEEIAKEGESAELMALRFSRLKAKSVSERHPEALVIASDQSGEIEGLVKENALLRKCWNKKDAFEQLMKMQNRKHRWYSSAVIFKNSVEVACVTETADVYFRSLKSVEIEEYLQFGEWKGCAGSYQIENRGISMAEKIEGSFHAILGFPLLSLRVELQKNIWE